MRVLGHAVIVASVLTACLAAFPQISKAEVQLGRTVILPCNISDTSRGELDVRWEAMGKAVAFFQEGQLVAGQGYEGRVELQMSQALQGDFSLTLRSPMMSDTDLYECLWQGRRSLSVVTLTVLPPPYPEANTTVEGQEVVLPCFGRIPKHKPWEKMFIQWFKDDKEILLLNLGEISKNDRDLALLPKESISHGILSLIIRSVRPSDQGSYKCFYKANDYEAPRSGVPETFSLSVLAFVTPSDIPPTTQEANDVSKPTTSALLFEIIDGTSEDSTTVQDTTTELLVQPGTSSEFIGLIAGANPDRTTVQDTVGVTSDSSVNTDFIGLIADASANSTMVQDPVEVTSELLVQPGTSSEFIGLIPGANPDRTTVQDTVGVTSDSLTQPSVNTGFIADASGDSTTVQDPVAGSVKDFTPELLPQPDTTPDIIGFPADPRADGATLQNTVGGEEDPFEFLWLEKVPWVRIGIISGVLLVTAAFVGTLVALGKL